MSYSKRKDESDAHRTKMSYSKRLKDESDSEEFDEEAPGKEMLLAATFKVNVDATIYRVPPEIYECDEKAYEPKVVLIGPFFRHWKRRSHLTRMQHYKWSCVKKLICAKKSMSGCNDSDEVLMEQCRKEMERLEPEVREKYLVPRVQEEGYSERFTPLTSDDFTNMLMADGCFLLHLLLRHADDPDPEPDVEDAKLVHGRVFIWDLIRYDLLLLQNQIPFLVIRKLYNFFMPDDKRNLVDCAINFFSRLKPCRKPKQTKFYHPVESIQHLLHLIYLSVLPCPQYCKPYCKPSPERKTRRPWIPSATELQLAGIKFKKRPKKAKNHFLSFLDVKFSDGVMEIPKIKVHDYSISLFRNFIAFEQCYPETGCHVTAYAFFMKFLVNTEKDMRLLQLNKILINSLTIDKDKDPTHFFSRLCNEVQYAHGASYLRNLFSDVNEYHGTTWRAWRAEVSRRHLSSPFTVISLFAGFWVLVSQLTQFVSTIHHY